MTNLMDYLDWRGDLPLSLSPFNEVDNLIFAELSFLDFEGIVPQSLAGEGISIAEAAERYFARHGDVKIDMGVLVPDTIPQLLKKLAACPRFRSLALTGYQNQLDQEKAQQFAAVTALLGDGSIYVAFRGTDDTLVGWKEDFRMTFLERVPSQDSALRYLTEAAKAQARKKLRIGGHSKGGNLAVYSAVNCGAALQRRILQVYNNDGPGFLKTIVGSPGHTRIAERILTIVPKGSMVGMLMAHEERFTVVDSSALGLYQHDGFSWAVRGTEFVRLEAAPELRRNDLTMKAWIAGMTGQQRETFTDALFEILSSADAKTLTDLKSDPLKSAVAMLKTMAGLDKETREALEFAVRLFFVSGVKVLGDDIRGDLREEREPRPRWNPLKKEPKGEPEEGEKTRGAAKRAANGAILIDEKSRKNQ